jgi:hypothetical protein
MLIADAQPRHVVLKLLPPDCLLEGQLNPSVAERLRRVREIAMTSVPTLIGVERRGDETFLVWQRIEGVPFETAALRDHVTDDQAIALVREMLHTVERFHATGLVHGALHSNNVLVRDGRIYLIDVSPLLFLDPKHDEQAVLRMVQRVADARNEPDSGLANTLRAALRRPNPMQELALQLSAHATGETLKTAATTRPRLRRRTLLAALLMLMIGIGIASAIARSLHHKRPTFTPPPLAPAK